jgi:type II secretory pathway predicted ATPase ExeA
MTNDHKLPHGEDLHLLLARLRAEFVCHSGFEQLSETFHRQMMHRRASIKLGTKEEAECIAVVGAPGSGKTTAVDRLFEKCSGLAMPQAGSEIAEVICMRIPSPATLKHVGTALLHALGYPLTRDRPTAFIWDQVRHLLRQRQTLFVHLDEAQDLHATKGATVRIDVVNTLKSLMNDKDWPVGLVLSGTPELVEMINSDHQFARRAHVVSLGAISWEADHENLRLVLERYTKKAGLSFAPDLDLPDFERRLIHAGANEFGLTLKMFVMGIEEALLDGCPELRRAHFAEVYYRKAGCIPAFNPFVAEDYWTIDARKLWGAGGVKR